MEEMKGVNKERVDEGLNSIPDEFDRKKLA